jgi:hypothetical protein
VQLARVTRSVTRARDSLGGRCSRRGGLDAVSRRIASRREVFSEAARIRRKHLETSRGRCSRGSRGRFEYKARQRRVCVTQGLRGTPARRSGVNWRSPARVVSTTAGVHTPSRAFTSARSVAPVTRGEPRGFDGASAGALPDLARGERRGTAGNAREVLPSRAWRPTISDNARELHPEGVRFAPHLTRGRCQGAGFLT